jgi:hypothetical protein
MNHSRVGRRLIDRAAGPDETGGCHHLDERKLREADMHRRILAGDRLIAAFLLGCLLFNYPLLAIFDRSTEVFGMPLIFAYVFFAWSVVIAVMAWAIEGRFR